MLYSQESKRFISLMKPNARLQLTFKALWKTYRRTLQAMKHSRRNQAIQSFEYIHKKMIITEQYLRNGIPRTMVDALFKELGV